MKTPEEILKDHGLEPFPLDNCILVYYPDMVKLMKEYHEQFVTKIPQDESLN